MIKDHQDHINFCQNSLDQEHRELLSKHQLEIDDYKLQITNLTDEKNIAERNLRDLSQTHKRDVDSLIATKNAMIKAKEKQRLDREEEFQQKFASLSDALETHKSEIKKLERDKQMEKESAVREATVFGLRG